MIFKNTKKNLKCENSKKMKQIVKSKMYDSLDINGGLGNFEKTNVVNVEHKSTNRGELIVDSGT